MGHVPRRRRISEVERVMATQSICDRCGAVIRPGNNGSIVLVGEYQKNWANGKFDSKWDLCPWCTFHLKSFITEKNKTK